jgi:hypothetical protein
MKGLYKAIGVGLLSVPLLLGGCKKEATPEQEYMKLQGTAFSERYMPASGSSFNAPDIQSRYSFSMDTEFGRKAVQVESTREITKESIDALVEPGTKVEIELEQDKKDQQVYRVPADKIRVIGE